MKKHLGNLSKQINRSCIYHSSASICSNLAKDDWGIPGDVGRFGGGKGGGDSHGNVLK
jgi:hypothetical protein